MTPQQTVGLGVRLFAVWLALLSVPYFTSVPKAISATGLERGIGAYFIGAIFLLVAAALWFFPMSVAHKLVPRTCDTHKLTAPAADVARVGCALLGLWILIRTAPTLVSLFFFRSFLVSGSASLFGSMSIDDKLEMLVYVIEVVAAVVLIVRSEWIARLMLRSDHSSGRAASVRASDSR